MSTENAQYSFYDSLSKVLFVANETGLLKITKQLVSEVKFKGNSIHVKGIVRIKEGLLIATVNNGLLILDKKELRHYLNDFDVPIHGLKKDGQTVYMSSNEKIFFFNINDKQINQIDLQDGLKPEKIIDFLIIDSNLWVLSTQSIQSICLDKLNKSHIPITCYFQHVYVNDSLIQSKETFNYEQNNFSFFLINNFLSNSEQIKYQYQLVGFDKEANTTKVGENRMRYNNLLPGEYIFKVNAVNLDGASSKEISYSFKITPPYWDTFWFMLLMIVLFLAIISSVFLVRIRFIKKKLTLENKIKASEIRAIRAQMNPHFIFNSLNSIQDLILLQDIRNSNHYLSVFADLMRSVLAVSEQDEITLEQEINILSTYVSLEKLRFEDDLEVQINCSLSSEEKKEIKVPSLLIQPYVENAFKHGLLHKKGKKKLEINFYLQGKEYIVCEIIDNGIGISRSKEILERRRQTYPSFSTPANQKRIDLLNDLNKHKKGKMILLFISNYSETEIFVGTKVELKFPL